MAHTDHHGAHHRGHDSAAAGHETSDASLGGIERFVVIMSVLLGVCFLLVWFLFGYFNSREDANDVRPSPVSPRPERGDRLPPLPRLQTAPTAELQSFRRLETDALERWAWVDKAEGVAQVPVERAIEILAERGLPTPPASEAPADVQSDTTAGQAAPHATAPADAK